MGLAASYNKHITRKTRTTHVGEAVIVNGGGVCAFSTAYEIKDQAIDAGKNVDVLLLTDKIHWPSLAGTHVVTEMEAQFYKNPDHRDDIHDLLRNGLQELEATLEFEGMQSRYNKGYEIKAKTARDLLTLQDILIDNKIYDAHEITDNTANQQFRLPGHMHSISINSIGQINAPELVRGLKNRSEAMGARVHTGIQYLGQSRDNRNDYVVHTTAGDFISARAPFLATGAEHLKLLPEFNRVSQIQYTMALVMGPLEAGDADKLSKGPIAFCDNEIDGDVLWGGIDEKGFFTFGFGDVETTAERDRLETEILKMLDHMYPGLTKKYKPQKCFGPILTSENGLPLVGRMPEYDVAGRWGSSGLVAGYAAAHAMARWHVHGIDDELKIFEQLWPDELTRSAKAKILPFPGPRERGAFTPAPPNLL